MPPSDRSIALAATGLPSNPPRRRRLRPRLTAALALCAAAAVVLSACGDAGPTPTTSGPQAPAASGASPSDSSAAGAIASAGAAASATSGGSSSRPSATLLALRLPAQLSRAVVGTLNGELLVLGGIDPNGTTADILRLDVSTGSAQRVGHLASAVHDASGAALGQDWLVIGGGRTVATSAVQSASLSSGGVAVSSVSALPAARADGASASIGGEIVVAGGGRGGVPDPFVLATRDGTHFSVLGRLRVAVRYPAADAAGGRLYLFGGATATGSTDEIQAIDPATGAVQIVGRLPYPLAQAAAFTLGGRVLIAGGMRGSRPSSAILAFDPTTARTSVVGQLPEAVASAGVAVLGDTAYLVGGETGSAFLDTVIAVR